MGCGTVPSETRRACRPWSASTMLPKTTLTSARCCSLPVESRKLDEMQTGNGSASSARPLDLGHRRGLLRRRRDRRRRARSNSGSTSGVAERVLVADLREPHGAAMADVGVGRVAGLRPEHLLEDQHIAGLEVGIAAEQRGLGGALRQAAVGVAPGVELHLVVLGVELRVLHRLEDDHAGIQRRLFIAGADGQVGRHARREGVEARAACVEKDRRR